jgi:hypothetical protein
MVNSFDIAIGKQNKFLHPDSKIYSDYSINVLLYLRSYSTGNNNKYCVLKFFELMINLIISVSENSTHTSQGNYAHQTAINQHVPDSDKSARTRQR